MSAHLTLDLIVGGSLFLGMVASSAQASPPEIYSAIPHTESAAPMSVPTERSPDTQRITRAAVIAAHFPFQRVSAIRAQIPAVTVAPGPAPVDEKLQAAGTNPRRIGVAVEIPELSSNTEVQQRFQQFEMRDGGRLLGIRIRAVGAVGMRLGLLIEHLPDQAEVTFFEAGATEPVAPPITGRTINRLIDLNRAAGDTSDEGRTYWSPVVNGEDVVIWIYLPHGIDPRALQFRVPRISYIFQDPLSEKAADSCDLDATCYADWAEEASGVAMMIFTRQGSSYQCTGTLLNDSDTSSFIPYFLSANHCISTQTAASTLQTFWFFQSASCNSVSTDPRYAVRGGGAQLLYANAATDTSFMRLSDQPPSGASYLGWTTADPDIGATVIGIHHTHEDFKDFSIGGFDGFFTFGGLLASTGGNHIGVTWTAGVTGDGSSGSPLLNSDGNIIGQLHGGRSSCANPEGMDYYGRFDLAYSAALEQWLGPHQQFTWITISGSVRSDAADTPVCAMVLANGQDVFSCDGTGAYSLTVPLDANGDVTLFGFADGFAPYRVILAPQSPANTMQIRMQTASADSPRIALMRTITCSGTPRWVHITGSVLSDGGQPVCALVLANGQEMFSCGGDLGRYDLTVPVDPDGRVTIFGFADGFQPYRDTFGSAGCNG